MSTSMIEIVSDYEYVLGRVRGNVLNLQAQFGGMDWARDELYIISKELENTGKMFAEKQGLRNTGHLIDSTHAEVDDNHHINFFNNANLGNGFYAGHIEYGHHTRDGQFVPARPFMRPALYVVAEASKGKLTGALYNYLNRIVYGNMSLGTLEFGRARLSNNYTRAFYDQQSLGRGAATNAGHYTTSGLLDASRNRQDAFNKMSATGHRGLMTPIVERDRKTGQIISKGNEHRFMTQNPTGKPQDTASTRRYQYSSKQMGRTGRPSEGKARVPSGKGSGRRREYAPGMQPSRQPTGNPRGRPRIYPPGMQPSRQPTGNPRGRPSKFGSNPKNWPSRQPTGNPRGRPKKPKIQGPKRRVGQRGKGKKTSSNHTKKRIMANERIKNSGFNSEFNQEHHDKYYAKYQKIASDKREWGEEGFKNELNPETQVPKNYAERGRKVGKKRGINYDK